MEKYKCKLCGKLYDISMMSEEHYPAHSVGNDDVVALDLGKVLDALISENTYIDILKQMKKGKSLESIAGSYFDKEFSHPVYPKGRTAKTLCINCNRFLGKYDEAYLKFFNCDGNPKVVKGFQKRTKIQIIKSIYGKFLSVPEAANEDFDFIDFVKDDSQEIYSGKWKLYFIKRDHTTDLFFNDISTGSLDFDEGIVYELSDDKFIFNLMNFNKHDQFVMNNIFDILDKKYNLVVGSHDESGGYHGQILVSRIFKQSYDPVDD